jgi:hypothetical protein
LAATVLGSLTSCATTAGAPEAPPVSRYLPDGRALYVEVDVAEAPSAVEALLACGGSPSERSRLQEVIERTEAVGLALSPGASTGAPFRAWFVARGRYPRGSLWWSVATNPGWRRIKEQSADAENATLRYWETADRSLQLMFPSRSLIVGSLGELGQMPGMQTRGRAVARDAGEAVPRDADGFAALWLPEPSLLLGDAGSGPAGRLGGLVSAMRMELLGRDDAADGEGDPAFELRGSVEFASERDARVGLVLLRLGLPSLLGERAGIEVEPQALSVERNGLRVAFSGIPVETQQLRESLFRFATRLGYNRRGVCK